MKLIQKLILILFALFLTASVYPQNNWYVSQDGTGGTYISVRVPIDTAQTNFTNWVSIPWYDGEYVPYNIYVTSSNAGSSDSVNVALEGLMITGTVSSANSTVLTGEADRIDTVVSALSTAKANVLTDTLNIQTGVLIKNYPKFRLRVFGRAIAAGFVNFAVYLKPKAQYKQ